MKIKAQWSFLNKTVACLAPLLSSALYTWAQSACVLPNQNLIDWWAGDGNTAPSIGQHSLLWMGGTAYTNGVVNQAFSFDGSVRYLKVVSERVLIGPRTFEAWILPRVNTGLGLPIIIGGISSAGDFFGLYQYSSSAVEPELTFDHWGFASVTSGLTVRVDSWNHVALTYDGTNVVFYVNGVRGNAYKRTFYDYSMGTFTIGGNTIGGTTMKSRFAGFIDEVAIYDRALTDLEIASLYAARGTADLRSGALNLSGVQGTAIQTAVEVSWPSVTNGLYKVRRTTNVGTNAWEDFGCIVIGNGSTNHFFDTMSGSGRRFYQIFRLQ